MGTKSKIFRAFVEGETISDGRNVTAEMIDNIVETFNVETYAPQCNLEHISGYSPEPPFNNHGTVIAVEARTDDIVIAGKTEKRRALYAQVDASDAMVELSKREQKPFPSVELSANYAGTGKYGLIGLAFTDTPASIATQRLNFSRVNNLTLFTSSERAALAFEAEQEKVDSIVDRLFSAVAAKFGKTEQPAAPKPPAAPTPANDNFDFAAFTADMKTAVTGVVTAAVQPIAEAQAALTTELAGLKTQLAGTEQPRFSRQPSTGGADDQLTDC